MRKKLLFALFLFAVFNLLLGFTARVEVLYVVDGDTLMVKIGRVEEKVRLIGIDTPEIHFGSHLLRQAQMLQKPESQVYELGFLAKARVEEIIESCSQLILETDVQLRDKYGRLLGYLWCDGKLINEELLREGYAMIYTFPPNVKYVERFISAQKQARKERKGVWK